VADILITHLSSEMFYKSFYSILQNMKINAINMVKFLNNVELIVSDFCLTQQEGVRKAIRIFCLENKIEIQVDSLFSACLFHFGQSALRKKKKEKSEESRII
jgi:hypothetical protein